MDSLKDIEDGAILTLTSGEKTSIVCEVSIDGSHEEPEVHIQLGDEDITSLFTPDHTSDNHQDVTSGMLMFFCFIKFFLPYQEVDFRWIYKQFNKYSEE